jgi:hypothetical protein
MTYRICKRSYFANQAPHLWRSAGAYEHRTATMIIASLRREFPHHPAYLGADCWMVPA